MVMKKSHLIGVVVFSIIILTCTVSEAAATTYTDSYDYYYPSPINPGTWSEEWVLIAGTSADYSWTFDLTTQGFNPINESVLSAVLSVRLADDSVVIYGGTGDGPSGDPNEQAQIAADSQTFLTSELNSPQTYTFSISLNDIQEDGMLIVTASTVPDNYGDFVIDRSSLVVETSTIPIPSAVWLFGSGLLGLIGVARKKVRV